MEPSESNAEANAAALPDDSTRLADNWLRRESTKLVLSTLDGQRKARRSAAVLLWSAAAYVCIATVGHLNSEATRSQRLDRAETQLDDRKQKLEASKNAEEAAFKKYNDAFSKSERSSGQVQLASKDVEISESEVVVSKAKVDEAQRTLEEARHELTQAQSNAAEFEKGRIPGDHRVSLESHSSKLKKAVKRAEERVRRAKQNLEDAQESKSAAVGANAASSGSSVAPKQANLKHKEVLGQFVSARGEQASAKYEWRKSQRELAAAQSSFDVAQSEHEKLAREPNPLNLPVLSLNVMPAHYFLIAPLMLLILFWNVVVHDWAFKRSVSFVAGCLVAESIDALAVTLANPELDREWAGWVTKSQLLLPDLATLVTLALLTWSKPPYAAGIALMAALATLVLRVRSLLAPTNQG